MDWLSGDLLSARKAFKQQCEFTFRGPLKQKSEEANENAIREARAQLPAEPLESSDTVTIRLRGPRDQSVQRTFFHSDTTEVLYHAAFALLELPSYEFRLRLHAVIIENNATLAEHGLGATNSILLSVDM